MLELLHLPRQGIIYIILILPFALLHIEICNICDKLSHTWDGGKIKVKYFVTWQS